MDKALLDTGIFSEVLKGVDPNVAAIPLRPDLVLVAGNPNHHLRVQARRCALKPDNWRL